MTFQNCLIGIVLVGSASWMMVSSVSAERSSDAVIAQALPQGSRVEQPLRRGQSGEIEIIGSKGGRSGQRELCTPGALCVGKDQVYQSLSQALAAARPGMTIELTGGTYRESVAIRVEKLTIRGTVGTPRIDCAGLTLENVNACVLIDGNDITLKNLDISGAALPEKLGASGACIRNERGYNFTLREVACHGSQDGILSIGGNILIENSEFFDNGWTGLTHNAYLQGECTAIIRGSTFRDARVGDEFKSRCSRTRISDSIFRGTHGSRNLDIPDGGETMIYRSVLEKTGGAQGDEIVAFTSESCSHPGHMVLKDMRVINSRRGSRIHNFDKCLGQAIVLESVVIEGLPVAHVGYILYR